MGFLKTEFVIKGKRVKHTKYVNSILSIQLPILNSQYFISWRYACVATKCYHPNILWNFP